MQLADGNVPVERYKLPPGQMAAVDATVAKMQEIAGSQYGSKSPKIRAAAINIIRQANVAEKDYYGQIVAIHEWIKRNILYVKDPVGQETLSYPEELLFNTRAGDCDDMVVLEMALLASVGIKSFPVVMGVNPQVYSHVYLKAIVPPGKHRMANRVIPLDPIMKNWKAGRQAPKSRRKIQKEYPATEIPAMSGQDDDLADMLSGLAADGLGEYYEGPSYLDTEHSGAENLLVADDYEGGLTKHRTMATTPHANVPMEGLDGLFGLAAGDPDLMEYDAATAKLHAPPPTMSPIEEAEGDNDEYRRLYNYGPLHNQLAQKSNRPLPDSAPGKKSYATAEIPALIKATNGRPAVNTIQPTAALAVEPHMRTVNIKDLPKTADEEVREINNLEKALKDAEPAAKAAASGPVPPGSPQAKAIRRVAIIQWLLSLKGGINTVIQERLAQVERGAKAARARGAPQSSFALGAVVKERVQRRVAANKARAAAKKAERLEKQLAKNGGAAAEIRKTKIALTEDQKRTGKPAAIDASPDAGEMEEYEGKKRAQVEVVRGGRLPGHEIRKSGAMTGREREMLLEQNGRGIIEEKIKALEDRSSEAEVLAEQQRDAANVAPTIEAPIPTQLVYDPSLRGRRSYMSRSFLNQNMLQPFAMPSFLTASQGMSGLGELPKLDMSFLPGPLRLIVDNAVVQYSVAGLAAILTLRLLKGKRKKK